MQSLRSRLSRRPIARLTMTLMAFFLVAAACGGTVGTDDVATTGGSAAPSDTVDSEASDSEAPIPDGPLVITAEVRSVELPDGIEVFYDGDFSVIFGGAAFMVSPREGGARLMILDRDGVRDTAAVIPGAQVAEVFNSGSQVVMTGRDDQGRLVVLASSDGATFVETVIPIPDRYLEADVWTGTDLRADVGGVADLGDGLYLIAEVGLEWTHVNQLVARHGYTISQEVGDAAVRAGTVRAKPQDGDTLYTFLNDGEVVLEVLGSEAGIEAGYEDAFNAAIFNEAADIGFTRAWIITDGVAQPTADLPFGGGLDEDLRLSQLYPIRDGVAAVIRDFSPDVLAPQPSLAALGGLTVSAQVAASWFGTQVVTTIWVRYEGDWYPSSDPIGDSTRDAPTVVGNWWDGFTWYQPGGADLVLQRSDDGVVWEKVEGTVPIATPEGSVIRLTKLGDDFIATVYAPGEDSVPRVFHLSGTGMTAVEIDVESGEIIKGKDDDFAQRVPATPGTAAQAKTTHESFSLYVSSYGSDEPVDLFDTLIEFLRLAPG